MSIFAGVQGFSNSSAWPGLVLRAGAVGLCAVTLVFFGSSVGAHASTADSDVISISAPLAVVESLDSGGQAYEEAVELRAAEWQQGDSSGPEHVANIAQAVASPLVFGRVYPLVRLQVSADGGGTLGASDLADDDRRYVSFDAHQSRGPLALTVSERGEMVEFGPWDEEQVQLLESMPEGGYVATLAMPLTGTFWIDGEGRRVVALDSSAEELVKGKEISAQELRARVVLDSKASAVQSGEIFRGGWSRFDVGVLVCALLGAVGVGVMAARSQSKV